MLGSFVHRVRSSAVSALRTADDALAWAVSPVPASVKNWLTVLFLGVTLLGVGLSYVYVMPSLQNRLTTQKLNDLSGSTVLVAQNIANIANNVSPGQADLQQAATFDDARINARVVIILRSTGNLQTFANAIAVIWHTSS